MKHIKEISELIASKTKLLELDAEILNLTIPVRLTEARLVKVSEAVLEIDTLLDRLINA